MLTQRRCHFHRATVGVYQEGNNDFLVVKKNISVSAPAVAVDNQVQVQGPSKDGFYGKGIAEKLTWVECILSPVESV